MILGNFKNSGKRKNILEEIQEELGLNTLGMLKFHAVRWLSRSNALSRIIVNYVALRRLWEIPTSGGTSRATDDECSPSEASKLQTLQKETSTHKFLGSLACCHDILYQQAEVNRYFQRDVISYRAVQHVIAVACTELEETYLESDDIGGKEYNRVRAAMRRRIPLTDALAKTEVGIVELLKDEELHNKILKYLQSMGPNDMNTVTENGLIKQVGEKVLELETEEGRQALNQRRQIFRSPLSLFQTHLRESAIDTSTTPPVATPTATSADANGEGSGQSGKRKRSEYQPFKYSNLEKGHKESTSAAKLARGDGKTFSGGKAIKVHGEARYVIEKILDEDVTHQKFKCKWLGYPDADNSWEPLTNMPIEVLNMFRKNQEKKTRKSLQDTHQASNPQEPLFAYKYFSPASTTGAVDVVVNEADEKFVSEGVKSYVTDVIAGLKGRFPDEGGSVLACFDIFHLESLPDTDKHWKEFEKKYGDKELKTLCSHYAGGEYPASHTIEHFIASSECHAQWRLVRKEMWTAKQKNKQVREEEDQKQKTQRDCNHSKQIDTARFWMEFLQKPRQPPFDFPDIRRLVEIFLVIVLSSVHCERFFSQMNLTKSLMRSRMLTDLLNDLMMIKLNGPDCTGKESPVLKRLIDRVYEVWKNRKSRYPKRSRTGPRPEQRKKSKSDMEGIKLARSEEAYDDMGWELSDKTCELDDCVCDASKNTNNMNVYMSNDMSEFSGRRILTIPDEWTVLPVTEVKIEGLPRINEKSVKMKIAIQLKSGWVVNGYCEGFEEGECMHHYQQNIGWFWVSLLCSGDVSRSKHLCNLEKSKYGMESGCTWCILTDSAN